MKFGGWETRCSESHTLLAGAHENSPKFFPFFVRFGYISARDLCTKICCVTKSFAYIGAVKANALIGGVNVFIHALSTSDVLFWCRCVQQICTQYSWSWVLLKQEQGRRTFLCAQMKKKKNYIYILKVKNAFFKACALCYGVNYLYSCSEDRGPE